MQQLKNVFVIMEALMRERERLCVCVCVCARACVFFFTAPPIQWIPGGKAARREADHSPPTSAKVKKMWIYTSTPPYTFLA
jgi:hypothetical protein